MTTRETPWITSASPAAVRHYKQLLETRTLGQWDLHDRKTDRLLEPTVIIEAVRPYVPERRRQVRKSDGTYVPEPIKRYEIRFVGKKKTWLAGPVSLEVLASLFGPSPSKWLGQKITLYVDESVTMGRRKTGGIRVRAAGVAVPGNEELDNDVDPEKAIEIAEAFAEEGELDHRDRQDREPGEEG